MNNTNELPLGLAMALAQNSGAMRRFSSMTQEEQQSFAARAHNVTSKKEMRALIDSLCAK